jgi:hypothetical protein
MRLRHAAHIGQKERHHVDCSLPGSRRASAAGRLPESSSTALSATAVSSADTERRAPRRRLAALRWDRGIHGVVRPQTRHDRTGRKAGRLGRGGRSDRRRHRQSSAGGRAGGPLARREITACDLVGDRVDVVAPTIAGALGRLRGGDSQVREVASSLRIEAARFEPHRSPLVVEPRGSPRLRGGRRLAAAVGQLAIASDGVDARYRPRPVNRPSSRSGGRPSRPILSGCR